MKKIVIETHCHSLYSHDSNLAIDNIAEKGQKIGLTHIVICDHDIYGKTQLDRNILLKKGIELINAIEFTTFEGIHIIGINNTIAKIQSSPFFYKTIDLINLLRNNKAIIIIPHPYHSTGIIGNGKLNDSDISYCLKKSNFIEVSNYKYGTFLAEDIFVHYPNLKKLIGSDAHCADMVGAQYNEFMVPDDENNVLEYAYSSDIKITHIYRKKHNTLYWKFKAIKKTFIYQFVLNLFPYELRRFLKNKLFNK